MNANISRREFGKKLAALVSGTTLFAQQPSCTSLPQALPTAEGLQNELNGTLLIDDITRQAAAEDFGLIIYRKPMGVLKPRTTQDVVRIVTLANRRGIKVAMRGQGHSAFGQAQVEGGVVIDSSTLNSVRMTMFRGAPAIKAEAGALWGSVLDLAYADRLTPPVNVDRMFLSVGGTISTGGFGGTSWRDGFQTDHVLELQVVTGQGKLVTCSDERNSDLFNAALGGMGQCGLIVEATLELVRAPTHTRLFVLSYPDLETLTSDLMTVVNDRRFDHLDGRTAPRKGGGFTYNLEAGAFYTAPKAPGDAQLLAGLSFASQAARIMTYVEYYRRLPTPLPRAPHPWLFLCLPASKFLEYAKAVYATPAEFAYSPPRFSVWKRSSIKRPLTRIPTEDLVVRFQCSRSPPAAEVPTVIAMNRTLYERARDMGGTHVTTGAIPFSQADWIHHYGSAWVPFRDAKRQYDPNNVLTPGPGIFPG